MDPPPGAHRVRHLNILYLILRVLQISLTIALLGISSHLHLYGSRPPFNLPHDWNSLDYTWPTWFWGSPPGARDPYSKNTGNDDWDVEKPLPTTDATISLSLFVAASVFSLFSVTASLCIHRLSNPNLLSGKSFFMFFDIVPIFILLLAGVAMGGQVLSECRAWGWRNISAVLYRTAFALGLVEALMFIGTAGIAWYGWAMEQKILKLERERRERGKIVRTQA